MSSRDRRIRRIRRGDQQLEGQNYLNPYLYRRLRRLFGSVLIAHEGEKMIGRSVLNPVNGGRRMLFAQHGEAYRVNCFACSDTRHRLYISYMYGQRGDDGRTLSFMAMCFNEDCMAENANRLELRDMLEARDGDLGMVRVREGRTQSETVLSFEMPGDCVRLDELPSGHDARAYVVSRYLDPDRLARVWGVSYCRRSNYPFVKNRLVTPIRFLGKMAGWQSRHIGETDWKAAKVPKYFTCPGMRRDLVICNWDMARSYRTLVLVEGWFDVFGFGPMAACTLGVGMSSQQIKHVVRNFNVDGRSVVLLYDADVFEKPKLSARASELVACLARMLPGRFVNVRLPSGLDPGGLDRAVSRDIVEQQADAAGVPVWWSKYDADE